MNILLTSVGRRAYLVKFFQDIVHPEGKVFVCNSDPNTVAFQYADQSVVSPLIYDEKYIPFLIEYCQTNKIDLLLSLFDIDLLILSKNKEKFLEIGTKVIVSDEDIISICNDKWKTYLFLSHNDFHTPQTFLTLEDTLTAINEGNLHYPVIVKPRFGCGSLAVSIAEDEEELRYCFRRNKDRIQKTYLKYESAAESNNILVQELLCGQEYGADIINDLTGQYRQTVVRKKIAMRAGETDIAQIVSEPVIEEELERLGKLTHHIANMDCDAFLVNGVPYILEMNARFGGGYPFSHLAGCNLPKAIVEWAKGNPVPAEILKAKTGITGFKELIITEGNFGQKQ